MRARIIWCEDAPRVLQLLRATFRNSEHDLVFCASPAQAIAEFLAGGADLIVTDLAMPEMNGLDLIAELRRLGADGVPTIVVSASSNRESRRQVAEIGAQYLAKPFSPRAMVEAIESALGERV
jgi:DNA-binding response OmpR family regulator